jgi:glycosyltransferase involved in cell wall biosynthesis
MLAYNEILQMPNCIDVNLFKPLDKTFARNFYNIPLDKHVIMFGAVNATSDKNKGFDLLLNSISNFNESKSICLIVLGATEKFHISNFNGLVIPISHRYDEESLVMLYNCADVVVVPSRQENFSNTILESLSCGIPVVAFNAGGNSDLIIHKKSGYLANANDSFDLFNGITYVLNHNFKNDISKQARDFVFNNFSYEIIAEKYINLYKKYL